MNNCTKIKRVYLAGPITPRGIRTDTSNGAIEHLFNVRDMIKMGLELMKYGFAPFVPGIDFSYFLVGDLSEKQIKSYSTTWLEVCDAVLLMPRWETSDGTLKEKTFADKHCIPVFHNLRELLDATK